MYLRLLRSTIRSADLPFAPLIGVAAAGTAFALLAWKSITSVDKRIPKIAHKVLDEQRIGPQLSEEELLEIETKIATSDSFPFPLLSCGKPALTKSKK